MACGLYLIAAKPRVGTLDGVIAKFCFGSGWAIPGRVSSVAVMPLPRLKRKLFHNINRIYS